MSQEQSVHVSLKCQSWGSPNVLAQHDCLPHDSQRPSTWTTQKPKNIQKNKLAMFLYFQSGLVPHLFPWSCLQLLFATLHSIPDWSLLLFFLFNYQLCISMGFFLHCNQFSPVSIWVWSPSKHFCCFSTPITRQTPAEFLPSGILNLLMCSAAQFLGTNTNWFWNTRCTKVLLKLRDENT